MVGRKNVNISPWWWTAKCPTLRIIAFEYIKLNWDLEILTAIMGVRRIFFREGKNIPFSLKTPKKAQFLSKKVKKTYYFAKSKGNEEQDRPLARTPLTAIVFVVVNSGLHVLKKGIKFYLDASFLIMTNLNICCYFPSVFKIVTNLK